MGKYTAKKIKKVKYNKFFYFNTYQTELTALVGKLNDSAFADKVATMLNNNLLLGKTYCTNLQVELDKAKENIYQMASLGDKLVQPLKNVYANVNVAYIPLSSYSTDNMKSSFSDSDIDKYTYKCRSHYSFVVMKTNRTDIDNSKYLQLCQIIGQHNEFVTDIVSEWHSCQWVPTNIKNAYFTSDARDSVNYQDSIIVPQAPLEFTQEKILPGYEGNLLAAAKKGILDNTQPELIFYNYKDGLGVVTKPGSTLIASGNSCQLAKTPIVPSQVLSRIQYSYSHLISAVKSLLGTNLISIGRDIKLTFRKGSNLGYYFLPVKDNLEDITDTSQLLSGTFKISYKPKVAAPKARARLSFRKTYAKKTYKRSSTKRAYKKYAKKYTSYSKYPKKRSYVSKYPKKSYKSSKYSLKYYKK